MRARRVEAKGLRGAEERRLKRTAPGGGALVAQSSAAKTRICIRCCTQHTHPLTRAQRARQSVSGVSRAGRALVGGRGRSLTATNTHTRTHTHSRETRERTTIYNKEAKGEGGSGGARRQRADPGALR
jgi:hypothetical protein